MTECIDPLEIGFANTYQTPGLYKTVSTHSTLEFRERNPFRMNYFWEGQILTTAPTRFFERRSGWTGHGTEGPPRIQARKGDVVLGARRHGPIYREGQFEYYLVDLGARIESGERLTIGTESLYVDEAGTFDPRLTCLVRPNFESAALTVRVRDRVSCVYVVTDPAGKELHRRKIEPTCQDKLFNYAISTSIPRPGIHGLYWEWPY